MGMFDTKQTTKTKIRPADWAEDDLFLGLDDVKEGYLRGEWQGDYSTDINANQRQGARLTARGGRDLMDLARLQKGRGLDLLQGFDPAMDYYRQAVGLDPSQRAAEQIDIAGQFMNNPNNDAILADAERRATESYREQVLGPMAGNYAAGGAQDSSKYAQNFARQGRNLAADIQGNAVNYLGDQWNQGLRYAGNQQQQTDMMGMQGAGNLMNAGMTGMGYLNQGYDNNIRAGQIVGGAGDYMQKLQQQENMGNMQNFYAPYRHAQEYLSTVLPVASTFTDTKSTTTSSPSTFGTLANMALQGGAAFATGGASLAAGGLGGVSGMGGGINAAGAAPVQGQKYWGAGLDQSGGWGASQGVQNFWS